MLLWTLPSDSRPRKWNARPVPTQLATSAFHVADSKSLPFSIDSLTSYFDANLALLDPAVRRGLFPPARPVYTKLRDCAPAQYGLHARVENSLVADGCNIEGEVYNSIIFRGVTVGRGAVIKNCVLMQNTIIGANASMNCIITDKNVIIKDRRVLSGSENHPFYISKGTVI